MHRESSKRTIKIDVQPIRPANSFRTPTYSQCLTERNFNIVSPASSHRHTGSQRKMISIDIKKRPQSHELLKSKQGWQSRKIVKMKKKRENYDALSTQQGTKVTVSRCSSDKKMRQKQIVLTSRQPIVKCFDRMYKECKNGEQRDWEDIIKKKKNQLYSNLYRMDQKIFAFQRDLGQGSVQNKQQMIDIVTRKMKAQKDKMQVMIKEGGSDLLSCNIYKMSRLRHSNRENISEK